MPNVEFAASASEAPEFIRGVLTAPLTPGLHPAVIFTHGLLSRREEFGNYPKRLTAHGIITLAVDLRGHGASDGPRGYVSQPRGVEDIRRALDYVSTLPEVDSSRLGLVGHSLGAAFSVCAAASDPRVRVLVAIAPPASIHHELKPGEAAVYAVGYRIGTLYKRLTGKSLYFPYRVTTDHIFHHETARRAARAQNFLERRAPHENALTLVKQQDTLTCATQVRVPTLVMVGEHDRVVSSSHLVYEKLAGPKEFVRIADSGHSIMLDGHGDEAFAHVANWLEKNLA